MTTSASAIIHFITGLHGVDRLQRIDITDKRPGAFDLLTAQTIEASPDYPEGDMLVVESMNGKRNLVHTHILMEALIVRTAQAWSITEGGGLGVRDHYVHLKEHLSVKTGSNYS